MRINFALLRQQADIYRSKGLYKEAQDLYAGFVAQWAEIDPDIRSAIEEQLKIIESKLKDGARGTSLDPPPPNEAGPDRNSDDFDGDEYAFRSGARDERPAPGIGAKDEGAVKNPDWIDGMTAIYSMVSNDGESADDRESKPEAPPGEAGKMCQVLRLDRLPSRGLQRAFSSKPVIIAVVAVVLLAGYFASWLSKGEGEQGGQSAQEAAAVVYKKMPVPAVDREASGAVSHRPGDPQPASAEESPGRAEAPRVVGPVENGVVSPEEPDPASAIDYVFKKRGMDR